MLVVILTINNPSSDIYIYELNSLGCKLVNRITNDFKINSIVIYKDNNYIGDELAYDVIFTSISFIKRFKITKELLLKETTTYQAVKDNKQPYHNCIVLTSEKELYIYATCSEGIHIFFYHNGEYDYTLSGTQFSSLFKIIKLRSDYIIANTYMQNTLQIFKAGDINFFDSVNPRTSCTDIKLIFLEKYNLEYFFVYDQNNVGVLTLIPIINPYYEHSISVSDDNLIQILDSI